MHCSIQIIKIQNKVIHRITVAYFNQQATTKLTEWSIHGAWRTCKQCRSNHTWRQCWFCILPTNVLPSTYWTKYQHIWNVCNCINAIDVSAIIYLFKPITKCFLSLFVLSMFTNTGYRREQRKDDREYRTNAISGVIVCLIKSTASM